jgi:N-acetylglucosamine kinase-like BadF-type ATPase
MKINLFTLFKNTSRIIISVEEDTYAAVYANHPRRESYCTILGTGSNCSYFERIASKVQSPGYIVMDDCSGNVFGKELIKNYFNKMPQELATDLKES